MANGRWIQSCLWNKERNLTSFGKNWIMLCNSSAMRFKKKENNLELARKVFSFSLKHMALCQSEKQLLCSEFELNG